MSLAWATAAREIDSAALSFSWPTFLARVAASVLVSFLVFLLGQRHSKNQIDRSELKERYRRLVVHFEGMLEAAVKGEPLRRSDYDPPANASRSYPLVEQLRREGRLHELPNGEELLAAEIKVLELAAKYHLGVHLVYTMLVDYLTRVAQEPIRMNSTTGDTSTSVETEGAQPSQNYAGGPLGAILVDDEFATLITQLDTDPALGIHLHWRREDARNAHEIWISPRALNGGTASFLRVFRPALLQEQKVKNALMDRERLIEHLSTTLEGLYERLRDPHPMWETVRESFRDFIRVRRR